MTVFEKQLSGYRVIETFFSDTLPKVALRELGDANRWPEIAWLNELVPPYLTDDATMVRPGVVLTGGSLYIPAPINTVSVETDPNLVFEVDIKMSRRQLQADAGGDFAVVAGRDNLKQQLTHRLATDKGELLRHPDYGCSARRLIGSINGPVAGAMAAGYVKAALLSDFRIKSVEKVTANIKGDAIFADARAIPITGRPIDVSTGS